MTLLRTALRASFVVAALVAPALAGTGTGDLTVTASVENSCAITSGALAFGVYDVASGAPVDAAGTLRVACTAGAVATIMLGQGANPDAGSSDAVPLRRLSDGVTGFLSYTLYSDPGRANVWGDTEGTGKGYTAPTAAPSDQIIYGRLAARQTAPVGAYADNVVVTIMF